MPRVTEQHREARRRQIIDAARRCFSRNGFHATSMQDVLREADLSAGALYRYFRSKTEIIAAVAEDVLGPVTGEIANVLHTEPVPPLADSMAIVLGTVEAQSGEDGILRVAVQVWGEALREPALGEFVDTTYRRFRSLFVQLAERARQAGHLPSSADPEQVGAVLFGLVPGYALQRLLIGDTITPEGYLAGLRVLIGSPAPACAP